MPLVSILIPAYRAGRFIGTALEGVRAQTHAEWEVVVVEDGSQDETKAVVQGFAASVNRRVCYERLPENRGVSATRNRAMQLAQGEVIAFLDADDRWRPEHLEAGLATLAAGADLCYSGFEIQDNEKGGVTYSGFVRPPKDALARLFESNFIQTSSLVMLRREAALKAGEFDPQLAIGEDCDYWMRILAGGGKLACTEKVTCVYTKHGGSAMAATLRVAEHSLRFYRKHLHNPALPPALRRRFFCSALINHARLAAHGDPALARSLFGEAWRRRPWDLRLPVLALRTFFL